MRNKNSDVFFSKQHFLVALLMRPKFLRLQFDHKLKQGLECKENI